MQSKKCEPRPARRHRVGPLRLAVEIYNWKPSKKVSKRAAILAPGIYSIKLRIIDGKGKTCRDRDGALLETTTEAAISSSRLDTLKVALHRGSAVHTKDQALWSAIRGATTRLQFSG
jgi:hypothetical protein